MADRDPPGPHTTAFGSPIIKSPEETGKEPNPEPDSDSKRHPWLPAPETYIVQVPKDQIYHVPPPENAALVERYRNQVTKRTKRSPVLCCFGWLCASVLMVVLLCVIIAVVFIVTVKPGKPEFAVDQVHVKDPKAVSPEYDLTMRVHNPSASMSYLYEEGGTAVLSYRDVNIANGKTPSLNQDSKIKTKVNIAMKGLKMVVPKQISNALNGSKNDVALELELEFGVSVKAWGLDINGMHVTVSCDLTSKGLLKEPGIKTQSCQTQFRS